MKKKKPTKTHYEDFIHDNGISLLDSTPRSKFTLVCRVKDELSGKKVVDMFGSMRSDVYLSKDNIGTVVIITAEFSHLTRLINLCESTCNKKISQSIVNQYLLQ